MSIANHQSVSSTVPLATPMASPVPSLENGDHLTREDFERRYEAMPHITKAELIEGIVYMPSPVRFGYHGEPHFDLIGWIALYKSQTPYIRSADNATNRLDEKNEPQPDVMLVIPKWAGGRTQIDEDDYLSGPPELICEVAASSASIDLNAKKRAYLRNGIQEYLVWRTEEKVVDWFERVDSKYVPLATDDKGRIRSKVFPGLWLDVAALLAGDLAKVFAAVDEGAASEDHAAFVKKLNELAAARPKS